MLYKLQKQFVPKKERRHVRAEYGLPESFTFEVISHCILDCEFCFLKKMQVHKYRRHPNMPLEGFKKVIDDIAFFTDYIQISGGEPLMNKHIWDMLDYARSRTVTTQLFTNLQLLTHKDNLQKLLDHPPNDITIALDSVNKETYETIRRKADFDNLISGIRGLIQGKKDRGQEFPKVILQMVLTKKNMQDEERFWELSRELGADKASLKPLGAWPEADEEYDRKLAEEYIIPPSEHHVSRHDVDKDGKVVFFRKPGDCSQVLYPYIGSGGEVYPCTYIVTKAETMGNAFDDNFLDLWQSERYRAYRHKMVHETANPLCLRCIGYGGAKFQDLKDAASAPVLV